MLVNCILTQHKEQTMSEERAISYKAAKKTAVSPTALLYGILRLVVAFSGPKEAHVVLT